MLFSHRNGKKEETTTSTINVIVRREESEKKKHSLYIQKCHWWFPAKFSFFLPFVCNLRVERRSRREKSAITETFQKFSCLKGRRQTIEESFTPLHISNRKTITFETKRNTTNIYFPCGRITHSTIAMLRPKCLFAVCVYSLDINIIRPSTVRCVRVCVCALIRISKWDSTTGSPSKK